MGAASSAALCFAVSLGGFAGSRRNLTIPVCFDFIFVGLSSRNNADSIFTNGKNHHDFRAINEPKGYEAIFPVILALIQSLDAVIVQEYLCSKWERDSVLLEIRGGFS